MHIVEARRGFESQLASCNITLLGSTYSDIQRMSSIHRSPRGFEVSRYSRGPNGPNVRASTLFPHGKA
jgi:hypothetical protein